MIKILTVDDTASWRIHNVNALEDIFCNQEVKIETANSAKDGYDKLLYSVKEPYDLIITDLQMESDFAPIIAGEWFIRQIKTFSQYFNTKILIVSAMYNIEMTANLLGVDFLSKRTLISGGELALALKIKEMGFSVEG